MISHGKDIKIFTGNANPKLAADICKIIGTKLGESEVKHASRTARPPSLCMRPCAAATCSSSSPPASPSTTTSWSCSS